MRECGYCHEPVNREDVLCPSCGVLLAAYESPTGSTAEEAAPLVPAPAVVIAQPAPAVATVQPLPDVPSTAPASEPGPATESEPVAALPIPTPEPTAPPPARKKWWVTQDEIPSLEEVDLAEDIESILDPDVPATTPVAAKRNPSREKPIALPDSPAARHSTPFATMTSRAAATGATTTEVATQKIREFATKSPNRNGVFLILGLVALVLFNVASSGPGLLFVATVLVTGLVFTAVVLRMSRRTAKRRTMDMPYDKPTRNRKS